MCTGGKGELPRSLVHGVQSGGRRNVDLWHSQAHLGVDIQAPLQVGVDTGTLHGGSFRRDEGAAAHHGHPELLKQRYILVIRIRGLAWYSEHKAGAHFVAQFFQSLYCLNTVIVVIIGV